MTILPSPLFYINLDTHFELVEALNNNLNQTKERGFYSYYYSIDLGYDSKHQTKFSIGRTVIPPITGKSRLVDRGTSPYLYIKSGEPNEDYTCNYIYAGCTYLNIPITEDVPKIEGYLSFQESSMVLLSLMSNAFSLPVYSCKWKTKKNPGDSVLLLGY